MKTKKNKILIIGDSLASHRDDDGYSLSTRWPGILGKNYKVKNLAKSYSTTKILKKIKKIVLKDPPDFIIIQLGIVDCVPRTFSRIEFSILFRLPKRIRLFLIKILKNIRVQSSKRAYVNPINFKKNISDFCSDIKSEIIYVKILSATNLLLLKNKNAGLSINNYNKIIEQLSLQIDNLTFVEIKKDITTQFTLDDGYHLNDKGHKHLSKILDFKINEIDS
tara:strand:+ start:18760 stop:19422 length:663 start_codon:yes stop_codon:yes gene_type:complete